MIDRVGLASGGGLFGDHIYGDAVLGVHHYEAAVFVGVLHGSQDLAVVAVEHSRICHEELEAGDAFAHEGVHLFERAFGHIAQDHVEAVIYGAVAFGFGEPVVQAGSHILAGALHCEVDYRGGAAPSCRPCASFKCVGSKSAAEGKFHVGVHINAAGHHIFACGVYDGIGCDAAGCAGRSRTARSRASPARIASSRAASIAAVRAW